MKLVVISPEEPRLDELPIVAELFAAGLARYHLRKPRATADELATFLETLPADVRNRVILHQHHDVAARFGAGRHWRDEPGELARAEASVREGTVGFTSRSCHTLADLRRSLGAFASVFFGPVFESVSKPGYGPRSAQTGESLAALLGARDPSERATEVLALGGITLATAPRAHALGFDGIAVLGAVWQAADPVAAFQQLAVFCRTMPALARGTGALCTVEG